MSNDAPVSDNPVAPPEVALDERTGTGSPEASAEGTQGAQPNIEEEAVTDPAKENETSGDLDPTDPDYWQKKYQRDETNWKKRHSDLMSTRQKAEHERDALLARQAQSAQAPVSKTNEPSLEEPETFETTKELTDFIEKKAAQIAEKQVRTYFENQDKAKAEQATKESYNTLWETALKDDPALDVNELAAWMQKENVFNPLHAVKIRNQESALEAAERRGAEKVLAKLKSNKGSATEGPSRTAPVAPKKVTKDQRARYIQEILESGERDTSH